MMKSLVRTDPENHKNLEEVKRNIQEPSRDIHKSFEPETSVSLCKRFFEQEIHRLEGGFRVQAAS